MSLYFLNRAAAEKAAADKAFALYGCRPNLDGIEVPVLMSHDRLVVETAFAVAFAALGRSVKALEEAKTDTDKAAALEQYLVNLSKAKALAEEIGKAARAEALAMLPPR